MTEADTNTTSKEQADEQDDKPSLRQRLHAATGDRDREAEALADRSPDEVTEQDAKVAVNRAHGESPEDVTTDSELASPEDAVEAAEDQE